MGDIGWGILDIKTPNSIVKNVDKHHVRYWDNKKSSDFLAVPGSFSSVVDRKYSLDYVDHLSLRDRRDYIKRLVNRNLPDTSKFFVNNGIVEIRNESEEAPKAEKCRKFLKMQQDYLNKLRLKQLIQETHRQR